MPESVDIRLAIISDLAALYVVVERAYRSDSAREGWTHEADFGTDDGLTLCEFKALLTDPRNSLLIAFKDAEVRGCVQVTQLADGVAYLGLLCVDPQRQSGGIGARLVDAAEQFARLQLGAVAMVMEVLEARDEVIAWYIRRGYVPTGRRLDFPIALDPPLYMSELRKSLD